VPGNAGIIGSPNAAARITRIIPLVVANHACYGIGTAAAKRADISPFQVPEERIGDLRMNGEANDG